MVDETKIPLAETVKPYQVKRAKAKIIDKTSPIGVFDSGVGGLTVVREIIRQLPNENIVYFGDTARVPYGSKSPSTVNHFSNQITRFLLTKKVKAIVVACNTASALAFEELKEQFNLPIVEVVVPGARAATQMTKSGKIGVVGTEATVKSGVYTRVIKGINPQLTVLEKACPLFVPLVEEGFRSHHVTEEIIDYYLHSLKNAGIDTLILGCTHYPLIRSQIKEYLGEGILLANPAYETTKDLKELLSNHGMNNDVNPVLDKSTTSRSNHESINVENSSANYDFYVSDGAEKFRRFAGTVMSIKVPETNVINIESF